MSIPQGATVIDPTNDAILGVTPLTLTWKNKSDDRKHIPIRLEKDGFNGKTTSFWLKMSHANEKRAFEQPKKVEITLKKKGT